MHKPVFWQLLLFAAQLNNVDATTFATNSVTTVTMPGFTVVGLNSITKNPHNGLYYVIVKVNGGGVNRRLATINPATGVCTNIGSLGDNFSSITFTTSGRCFGTTGSGLNNGAGTLVPKTLYEINITNASKTFRQTLNNGADGQVIAYNPEDGFIYHWSGHIVNIMEKLDTLTYTPVNIPQSGNPHFEVLGAVYKGGSFHVADINLDIHSITTSGVATFVGNNSGVILRGIAYAPCTVAPASPSLVSGPITLCTLTSATYSVPYDPMANTYSWTVPTGVTGMTITSGQGSNNLNVNISAGTVSGNVTVTATNACGTSGATMLAVTKKPPMPGAITGPTDVCGLGSATYSIAAVSGATSYTWTVPAGITITGGAGTTSINVNIASTFTTGLVKVMAVNACGSVPGPSLTLIGKLPPTSLTGPANVCGMSTASYSCNVVSNATSYVWTVPATWSILSGQGTNNMTATMPVNVNNATFSGVVKVYAVSACGNSATKSMTVSYCKSALGMNNGVEEENAIAIYPNPATSEFALDITSDLEKEVTVEVYDMQGKLVSNQQQIITAGDTRLITNIEQLNAGMYFVRVVDTDMNVMHSERLIKQ